MAYLIVNDFEGLLNSIMPLSARYIIRQYVSTENLSETIEVFRNFDMGDLQCSWLKITYKMGESIEIEDSNSLALKVYFNEYEIKYMPDEEIKRLIMFDFRDFPDVGKLYYEAYKKNGYKLDEEESLNIIFENIDINYTDYDIIYENSDCSEFLYLRLK